MAIHKRKRRGKVDWYFKYNAPGGSRENRRIIRAFGYATRLEAIQAESNRRQAEQQKSELAKAGGDEGVSVDDPGQSAGAEVQRVLDRRQRNVHDRAVEREHELD